MTVPDNNFDNNNDVRITIAEFRDIMFKPLIPIKLITDFKGKPIFEMFPYWRRHKVLPFIPTGKHWEDFFELDSMQLLWLRILDSLRQLNYPLVYMKALCEYFFKDSHDNDLPLQILRHNKKILEVKKKAGTLDADDLYLLELIDSLISNKQARLFMYQERNYLSELVIYCLTCATDAGIYLYPDGTIFEYVGDLVFSHKDIVHFDRTAPHIHLSVKHFLKEFITSEELEEIVLPNILTLDEKNVLEELRNNNIQELTIMKKGKKVVRIDSARSGHIPDSDAKKIRDILGLKNYENIEISTRDEKNLSFKRKRKKLI